MQGIPDQNHGQLKLSGMGGGCFYSVTPGTKVETIISVPGKIVQIPVGVPVAQCISSTLEEEELKSNATTSFVA